MSDHIIADGLEKHRYLKAVKLVDQFETELQTRIRATLDSCVEKNSHLFAENVEPDEGEFKENYGSTLATIRTDYEMVPEDGEGNNLELNIGVEWVEPEKQGLEDSFEGPLCYAQYKIKYGSADGHAAVKSRTEDQNGWEEIRFGEELWAYGGNQAPGIVYVPLNNGVPLLEALQLLEAHFSEYADILVR